MVGFPGKTGGEVIPLDAAREAAALNPLLNGQNPLLTDLRRDHLTWLPEAGVGYYEVRGEAYDQAYFDRYASQADTAIGQRLMDARCDVVWRHWTHEVLDVGIGCGAFLNARAVWRVGCQRPLDMGYDVNPAGVAWLKARNLFGDLYNGRWDAVTFWDVLEHMRDPRPALAACRKFAFVSIPIFRDSAHVLASKHFRRDEHYWYFTREGFIAFARSQGFEVLEISLAETVIGREDVETFVLRRRL